MVSREEKSLLACAADIPHRHGTIRPDITDVAPISALDKQAPLVRGLLDPAVYGEGGDVEHLETHISHVFLAGPYAYKVKKAINLGFLDFRTLGSRYYYCREELWLNRRLARELYLGIIAITGTVEHPTLNGDGPAIEYAVKMRRFPQEQLAGRMLESGALTAAHIDALADHIAAFHADATVADAADGFGMLAAIRHSALDNLAHLRATLGRSRDLPDIDFLDTWTRRQCDALAASFGARKTAGFVRECHGDLHLGNLVFANGALTPFDCLEFNENLRWIDVMSEVAFLVMDLENRKRADLARRFLNRYLERTGDYAGLKVLPFYLVYRALVRAKVNCLRANQPSLDKPTCERLRLECRSYLALARRYAGERRPALIVTHGISGSGKTTLTQSLLERIDAVRVRSDVERKRLLGFDARTATGVGVGQGAYSAPAIARTYERLLELARTIAAADYVAVVDATFLKRAHRDAFHQLALALRVPFVILDIVVDEATARARVLARAQQGGDASEADIHVLDYQLGTREPLQPDERRDAVVLRPERAAVDWTEILKPLRR